MNSKLFWLLLPLALLSLVCFVSIDGGKHQQQHLPHHPDSKAIDSSELLKRHAGKKVASPGMKSGGAAGGGKKLPAKVAGKVKKLDEAGEDSSVGISGGEEVEVGQVKFTALIGILQSPPEMVMLCTGSVLDQTHVLTTANCCKTIGTWKAYKVNVLFGGYSRFNAEEHVDYLREVASYKIHPSFKRLDFSTNATSYDICIVKINEPIQLSESFGVLPTKRIPYYLNNEYNDLNELLDLDDCWLFGYGNQWKSNPNFDDDNGRLYKIRLPIQLYVSFYKYNSLIIAGYRAPLPKDWVEPKRSMYGDSGGPFICRNKSVGLFAKKQQQHNSNTKQQQQQHNNNKKKKNVIIKNNHNNKHGKLAAYNGAGGNFNNDYIQIGLQSKIPTISTEEIRNFTYLFHINYIEPINCFYDWIEDTLKN